RVARAEVLEELGERFQHRRAEEGVLGAEVAEEDRFGDAGLSHDVLDGGLREAFLREDLLRGVDEQFAHDLGPAAPLDCRRIAGHGPISTSTGLRPARTRWEVR